MVGELIKNRGIQGEKNGGDPSWWWARLETLKTHKENGFSGYPHAIEQIKKMARGEDSVDNVRHYYPDWTVEDFKRLLRELGEKVPE